ncbi:LysR family transcriptional regulator [Paenibacillaceae bacterium]|nr:LysR family transcriptional regulator [Paenibacillaceae bacterium]
MELRQLHYVVQIAAEKNFSRAAEKLHIAQPSLSQQLSKLEKELGVLLFRRTTNSVELTHAGAAFVDKAQGILDEVEQLKQEMDDIAHMRKGKLVVGSLPITGSHILPLVLPVFQKQYPEIEIVLVEDSTSRLEQLTASGQTDLSLLSLPLLEPSLAWEPLIEEEICLAVPPQHQLAAKHAADENIPWRLRPSVNIRELGREPFIILKRGQGFRQIALDLCTAAGFAPTIVFESSNIETVQSLVAAGMGIAFVPMMVSRARWSAFPPVYLPLAPPAPSRTLVIASRRGRYLSKAASAFIETMMTTVEQHYKPE